MPAAAISRFMPTPMAARPATTAIPSYPYLFDQTRPVNGRQPNSAAQADGASIGGSYIFHGGFIGAAITQNDSLYRIPGIDGADHQTRIDAHQTKFTAKGEYRPDAAAIDAIRFWAGATDYKHNEIGLADPADPSTLGVRQTFTNKEQEGRVEVQMMPFNARFAAVTTAFGLQAGHQELTAPSPDDPGSAVQRPVGSEQQHPRRRLCLQRVQIHRRRPRRRSPAASSMSICTARRRIFRRTFCRDGNPQIGRHRAQSVLHAEERQHRPDPESAVTISSPASPRNMSSARRSRPNCFRAARTMRPAPSTSAIRTSTIETAKSVEIGLRQATGPFRFEATAYYTRFNNFIYRRLTGMMCGDDFASCGNGDPDQ